MAQQLIELGELPSGVGGDTNRSANVKCNENFKELYEATGALGEGKADAGANSDITSLIGLTTALSEAQGGTGLKSMDELVEKLLSKGLYNKTKALGPVSAVAGVGALMERGSNANGEYVKFADGTMICTKTLVDSMPLASHSNGFYFSPTGAWTYPFSFVSKQPFVGTLATASGITLSTAYAVGLQSCNFYVVAAAAVAAQQYTIRLLATGRWF